MLLSVAFIPKKGKKKNYLRVISYQTTIAKEQEYVRYCYKRFFKWDFEAHGVIFFIRIF